LDNYTISHAILDFFVDDSKISTTNLVRRCVKELQCGRTRPNNQRLFSELLHYHEEHVLLHANHTSVTFSIESLQQEASTYQKLMNNKYNDVITTLNEWMDDCDARFYAHGTSLEIAHDTIKSNENSFIELKNDVCKLIRENQEETSEKDNQYIHKINDCELKIMRLEQHWEAQQKKIKQKEKNDLWYNFYCVCMILLLWHVNVYRFYDYIVY
jgi:chromosome segregation ATPase